jgi:PTS system galactitol-specific IIC component
MGAVMELIPRITSLFIEGLKPISEATRELIAKKFGADKKFYIGMSPALVIGHPTTLVVSLLLIPVTLVMAVFLPGNQFLPLASLAGMFYVFVMVLPYTGGNVLRSIIVGLVVLAVGLYFVTWMAPDFTSAAHSVALAHPDDASVRVPEGFSAGALDFASSPLSTVIYVAMKYMSHIGAALLTIATFALVAWNRIQINKK